MIRKRRPGAGRVRVGRAMQKRQAADEGRMGQIAHLAMQTDVEELRKALLEGGAVRFAENLIEALKPTRKCPECGQTSYHPWAFRQYARCVKLTGGDVELAVQVVNLIGAPVEKAKAAVAAMEEVEGRSLEELASDAATILARYAEAEPISWLRLWDAHLRHPHGVAMALRERISDGA